MKLMIKLRILEEVFVQEMSVETISRLLEEMEGGLTSLPAFLLLPRSQADQER